MIKTWTKKINAIPNAKYFLKLLFDNNPILKILKIRSRNSINKNEAPIKPNSSATIAKIKSFCGSGKKKCFWILLLYPNPNNPLGARAYNDWIAWNPLPKGSLQGSRNDRILFNL